MPPRLLGLIPLNVPSINWVPHDMEDHPNNSNNADEAETAERPKQKANPLPSIRLPKGFARLSLRDGSSSSSSSTSPVQSNNTSTTGRSRKGSLLAKKLLHTRNRNRTPSAPSLFDDEKNLSRVTPQSQSSFFAKLPAEVRIMVYAYVMGEETLHLTLGNKKRFSHFVCQSGEAGAEGETHWGQCTCKVLVGGKAQSARLNSACTGILRVCWRMYLEAVPHLYTPNTFSLLHITHLLVLPTRIPHCMLNQIRALNLRLTIRGMPYYRRYGEPNVLAYAEDTRNWERAWEILGDMDGLKRLRVVIVDASPEGYWEGAWLAHEERLLQEMKRVSDLDHVEVVLPYRSCTVDWGIENMVFKRPGGEELVDEDQT